MRNFIQPGNVLTVTAAADVVSGQFVMVGSIFGVATVSAVAGTPFELQTGEVHELTKTSAQAWAVGEAVYATPGGIMTTVASGNTKVGVAAAAAANPSATGIVRLNASF